MNKYLVFVFGAALFAATLVGPTYAADKYLIDPTHVWVNFSIQQSPWAKYLGAFHDIKGVILFDKDNFAASSVQAEIATASVDTSNQSRDGGELQTKGFLNGFAFPKITYESTRVEKTGDKTGKIKGDLSMAGVTMPVTLDVVFNGEARSTWDGRMRVGFSATGSINTNDFGMTGLVPLNIGPQVDFRIEVEATKE
jgi:polyisoprenoid-binding protein YceI